MSTIDRLAAIRFCSFCGAIVTCENHQIVNGLGSAVAEVLVESLPTPMVRVGVKEMFGEVGSVDYLMKRFDLTAEMICKQAKLVINRKTRK